MQRHDVLRSQRHALNQIHIRFWRREPAYVCPNSIYLTVQLPSGNVYTTRSWKEGRQEGRKEGIPDDSSKTEGTGNFLRLGWMYGWNTGSYASKIDGTGRISSRPKQDHKEGSKDYRIIVYVSVRVYVSVEMT